AGVPAGHAPGEDPGVDGEELARLEEQSLAVGGEGHPPRRPVEERCSELRLELPDVAADRLLGDEQPLGGAGEAQLVGDRHEVPQRADVEVGHLERTWGIHNEVMLIAVDQVLDSGPLSREAGTPTNLENTDMDPAAL